MGIFDRFKRAFTPPRMSHSRFGDMTLMEFKDGKNSYWEGYDQFRPAGRRVEVLIEGDASGPFAESIATWDAIQDRYPELRSALEKLLHSAYADWIPDAEPNAGRGRFALDTVYVPRNPLESDSWSLSYSCLDDEEHSFTIEMKGWAPQGDERIDG